MDSLILINNIFKGEYSLENTSKNKLIAAISGTKIILENKGRLRLDINIDWLYASSSNENLIKVLKSLEKITGLLCFSNEEGMKVLEKLREYDFEKIINIVNSTLNVNDLNDYYKELMTIGSVSGKIYDTATPYSILEIAVKIINPSIENTFINSFNGESGVLVAIKEALGFSDANGHKIRYFGQEYDDRFGIGQLINFLITGKKDNIVKGNSIYSPAFIDKCNLKKFDVAISTPRFGMKIDKELLTDDIYNRFKDGIPRSADWIVVSHILSTINDSGKAAVLLPMGVLFRRGVEDRIRKGIIKEDLIEVIVKIPSNVLSHTAIPTCIMIFNKNKFKQRKNKIQFIDLSNYIEDIDRRNKSISKVGVEDAVKAYKELSKNDMSFFLDINQIEEREFNLNVFDYIKNERFIEKINNIKMTELYNVAQVRRGVQVNKAKLDTLNTHEKRTHYLISVGNIVDGKIIVNEAEKIKIERKWEGVYEVQKDDLLITSKGTQFKVAIVEEDIKAIASANLFIIRPYKDKYMSQVLKYYFESNLGQTLIEKIIKGTIAISIAHKDIEKLKVPCIDMKKQEAIAKQIIKANNDYEERVKEAEDIYIRYKKEIEEKMGLNI